jgi:hypothetical protein
MLSIPLCFIAVAYQQKGQSNTTSILYSIHCSAHVANPNSVLNIILDLCLTGSSVCILNSYILKDLWFCYAMPILYRNLVFYPGWYFLNTSYLSWKRKATTLYWAAELRCLLLWLHCNRNCVHRHTVFVMKTNLMHYLSLIYFVNQRLHVSVFTEYIQQFVRVISFCWLAAGRVRMKLVPSWPGQLPFNLNV